MTAAEDEGGGSGGQSVAGYEYQIDVSVWLALDLVLAIRLTQELVLEPASEEDIEAEFAEHEPGRLTSTAALDGYRLIVQAKLRGGDAWTVAGLKALRKHGDARPSAAKRLENENARYLLVTSAGLNGGTRDLHVRRAGSCSKPGDMPSTIKGALPAGSAGRVVVIGSEDEQRLATNIKALLTESFRVPNAKLGDCREALREQARQRGDNNRLGQIAGPEADLLNVCKGSGVRTPFVQLCAISRPSLLCGGRPAVVS